MRILDCLDASELPEFERLEATGEAAACLKEILDRVELPPYDEIPDAKAIEAAGGMEQLSQWRIPGTRLTIARVEEGPQRHEYLFSPGTVGRAVEYYQDVKSLPYRTTGPATSPGFYELVRYRAGPSDRGKSRRLAARWCRCERWEWHGGNGSESCSPRCSRSSLMGFTYGLHGRLAGRYRDEALFRYCLTIVFPIVAVLVALGFKTVAFDYLTLRGAPLYVVSFIANLTALLASLVVVFGASNRIAAIIIASPKINPQGLDAQFIRILSKLISVALAVIIFLEGGRYLGIPITTLIASAGVGGLAIALAAQDTLKNLFGTIMLLTDKPFRVGERIIVGKYDGVVEDIGLRSTRIRLLTGHQATIPNDELARTDIENVGRRPYIRRKADIHVPLDTPREKLEQAVASIRSALENHEGMHPDYPPRVYFFDFDRHARSCIRMIYWYAPPDHWDFLRWANRSILMCSAHFEQQGIRFSLPLRVTHTSTDSEQNPSKSAWSIERLRPDHCSTTLLSGLPIGSERFLRPISDHPRRLFYGVVQGP